MVICPRCKRETEQLWTAHLSRPRSWANYCWPCSQAANARYETAKAKACGRARATRYCQRIWDQARADVMDVAHLINEIRLCDDVIADRFTYAPAYIRRERAWRAACRRALAKNQQEQQIS